ncbi:NGFI-A-binding protein 1-like [Centruroides sculpturatus]|uniref:NGFI-A-binding protein 1-like n=1 Tax=Centruroides sculpturatus TaxID=218467 RepID=UPI000C6C933B|nr:NGFI-A-binding protein 1-like [Centruroides sculpturatus]
MNMADDDPRRMDEIRKYAAIYGRFDCKRKPEKPLTLHEVSVNEAAAQICKHIPALLTRRDELFPLARQVVRDSGYQYSKGHSRSQCYTKTCDEELCKRARLDPNLAHDKSHVEEVKKRRQVTFNEQLILKYIVYKIKYLDFVMLLMFMLTIKKYLLYKRYNYSHYYII